MEERELEASTAAGLDYADYRDEERRRALYRALARSMVRQLGAAGHGGRDLLMFAGEVMEAISRAGFDRPAEPKREPTERLKTRGTDRWGRPSFAGQRFVLRPPTPDDAPALKGWLDDAWVRQSLAPERIRDVLAILGRDPGEERLDLVLCDPDTDRAFGMVSLDRINQPRGHADLGKVIGDPDRRGTGLARPATVCLLRHAFDAMKLHRISLRTLGGNLRNIRLNEHMGFHFEGVLRDAFELDGEWRDVVLMGLLRDEFQT